MHTILVSLEVWLSLAIASYFGWIGIHHKITRQLGWYLIFIGLILVTLGDVIYLFTLDDTPRFWEQVPISSSSFPFNAVGTALIKVISEILLFVGLWQWMPFVVNGLQQQQELQQQNLQLQKMQAVLRVSEARFRTLFEHAPIGIILMDLKGYFASQSNAAAEKILGYTRQELVGKSFADISHSEDSDKNLQAFEQVRSRKNNYFPIASRCVHKGGSIKWVNGYVTWIPENILQPNFAFTLIDDVTEPRQQERNVKENYADLNFHLDNIPCAVMEWDAQLRLQRWSSQAERIFGWSASELMGKQLTDWRFIYEEDASIMAQELAQLHPPHQTQLTRMTRNYTKTGQVIYCEWQLSARFAQSSKPLSLLSLVRDVTSREQRREILGKNEELYRMLAENNHDLICLHEVDGAYLHLSPSVTRLLGYHPEELLGKSPYSLLHPDDPDKLKKAYEQGKAGQIDNVVEYRIRCQNGQYVWFETYVTPILNKNQQIIKLVTSSRNISQHKQAESALRESKKQLQRRNFEIHQLYEFSRDISGALSLDEIAEVLYEHLYRLIPTISCSSLVLVQEGSSDLCLVLRHRITEAVFTEIKAELTTIVAKFGGSSHLLEDIPMSRLKEYANPHQEIKSLGTKRQILLINFPPSHQINQPINGVLWLGAQATNAFSESQLRICYTLVNHLVNALKRSRIALTQEQKNLENLVQSLPIGVLLLDVNKRIILANPIAQHYLPMITPIQTNNSILTGPMVAILAPMFEGVLSSLSAVPLPVEAALFELTAHLLETGPYSGHFIVIIQDITHRHYLQAELEDQDY
ncbi:PAS domain S-box [Thioploca ingrica]|uniref:histidine kinase n=1 Tax=Thioploca ingrica TaxID=40754 RepID=A0A090AHC9_9GAMM|nr:PAS domain S-box [Thioploca ingrica]